MILPAVKKLYHGVIIFVLFGIITYQTWTLKNSEIHGVSKTAVSYNTKLENLKQFFDYIENPTRCCTNKRKFGGAPTNYQKSLYEDGNKYVCLDKCFDIKKSSCIVFSLGIGNEWSFDDDMANFGCKVYAFDHTMLKANHYRRPGIHFFAIGIGEKDSQITIRGRNFSINRLSTMIQIVNSGSNTTVFDYLKIDVEGAELLMFKDVFENSPSLFLRFKQIGMEIHPGKLPNSGINEKYEEYYKYFMLLENLGFQLFHSEMNPVPSNKYVLSVGNKRKVVNGYYELVWGRWSTDQGCGNA